ncbi:MAG TPA: prenyltransferase/squalene oxidase repeat-containing protein [Pirellulaceae bacterium]|nr:prenyltransferase/squalene oxidase repeat-containing protein [Pirellulaceae bacterium]
MTILGRRAWLLAVLAGCGTACTAQLALAQADSSDFERAAGELIKPATQAAIDRALAWLASRQNEDGSFGSNGYSRNAGVCALTGMAFMSGGSMPERGPYGQNVTQILRFLLKNSQENGLIITPGSVSHGPMYDHGFATLFLAEVYGMSPEPDLREKLVKAVQRIIESQNKEGGWRYLPEKADADISVTICQIMALRAARNAGIFVPNDTIEACVEYVKRSQNPDGGFMYMQTSGGPSAFPRSAAGVVALYSAGIYEGDELKRGLEYLAQHMPRDDAFSRESHYFYGQYYCAQAMWHAGGEHWKKWYPVAHDALLARQREDGSWSDSICNEYGTAMASIVLQMPNNYLPIFQR